MVFVSFKRKGRNGLDFTVWLDSYGYFVLFGALMFELIIFGIPAEIIMTYAGFLVFQGKLGWVQAILSSGIGTCMGITISYFIGKKLGFSFFKKHGYKFHMGPERLDRFSDWFGKYGNALIIVAYFIPGVRHVTGYFSGITNLIFRKFILFAFIGGFLWTSTFISLGKLLGPQWKSFHQETSRYLAAGGIFLVVTLGIIYLHKRFKGTLNWQSMKKVLFQARRSVIGTTAVFVILFAFLIGLFKIIRGLDLFLCIWGIGGGYVSFSGPVFLSCSI